MRQCGQLCIPGRLSIIAQMTTVQVGTERRPFTPFAVSNDLVERPRELRARALQDGYVFCRGLLPEAPIMQVRRDISAILDAVGWLDAGTDPSDAISTQEARLIGTPEFNPIYDAIQKLESFHTMAHHPALLQVAAGLLGERGMPQPSIIARVLFPDKLEYTTPPHQDFILVQGTPEVWTAWIPLGPCPVDLGGLAVLRGSHNRGILPVHAEKGAGGLSVEAAWLDGDWVSSPFETGDTLFFHSKTVHRGLPNLAGNRIRLSVDYRYQKMADKIMVKNLGVHQGRVTWEQVYAGWESDQFQYYWEGYEREVVEKELATEYRG